LPWSSGFDEAIPLPHGLTLVTLKDAGNYITKLPKAEHEAPQWQAAMEALILVATKGGPTMLARIGGRNGPAQAGRRKRISPMPSRLSRFSKTECCIPLAGFSSGSCWA
jgi:hypothetical protein